MNNLKEKNINKKFLCRYEFISQNYILQDGSFLKFLNFKDNFFKGKPFVLKLNNLRKKD